MTTEKDHVKLNPRISKGINFLEIELVLKKEKEFNTTEEDFPDLLKPAECVKEDEEKQKKE